MAVSHDTTASQRACIRYPHSSEMLSHEGKTLASFVIHVPACCESDRGTVLLLRRSPVAGRQDACDVHEAGDVHSHEGLCVSSGLEASRRSEALTSCSTRDVPSARKLYTHVFVPMWRLKASDGTRKLSRSPVQLWSPLNVESQASDGCNCSLRTFRHGW